MFLPKLLMNLMLSGMMEMPMFLLAEIQGMKLHV